MHTGRNANARLDARAVTLRSAFIERWVMSQDDFRAEVRSLLMQFFLDASTPANREEVLQVYSEQFTQLHRRYAHQLLDELIADAHTRLDARLSPDPIRQTIATVQTTMQDVWKSLTQTLGGPPPS